MRPELERLRRIEQHLLDPAATADLRGGDPALPADADAQRRAYQALYLAGQRQLRQELAAIHQRLYGPGTGRWVWTTAVAGLRLVFVRWARSRAKS